MPLKALHEWIITREPPILHETAVHVWWFSVREHVSCLHYLQSLLSQDEAEKASRYRFEADRVRSIVSRGLLRRYLASYLNVSPETPILATTAHEKPYLRNPGLYNRLHFNVSHSGDHVLIAFSTTYRVGIDVEKVEPQRISDDLTRTCFTDRELATWHRLAPDSRAQRFFQSWAQKEAYMKGLGLGLSLEPREVEVSDNPCVELPARLDAYGEMVGPWLVVNADVGSDAAAALAVEGFPSEIHGFRGEAGCQPI